MRNETSERTHDAPSKSSLISPPFFFFNASRSASSARSIASETRFASRSSSARSVLSRSLSSGGGYGGQTFSRGDAALEPLRRTDIPLGSAGAASRSLMMWGGPVFTWVACWVFRLLGGGVARLLGEWLARGRGDGRRIAAGKRREGWRVGTESLGG